MTAEKYPEYVQELIEVDKLPRTASGKVMRRELRKSHEKRNEQR